MSNEIVRSFAVGMYSGYGLPDPSFKILNRLYEWRILQTQFIISPLPDMTGIRLFTTGVLCCSTSSHCTRRSLLVTLVAGFELTEEALPAPHHAQPAVLQPGSHARPQSRLPSRPLTRPLQPQQLS